MKHKPRYKIRRIAGYKVVDASNVQVSPDFLSKEEAKDWIRERKRDANYY